MKKKITYSYYKVTMYVILVFNVYSKYIFEGIFVNIFVIL